MPSAMPRLYRPDGAPPSAVLVQEGLCESWLVKAPQCQTYGDDQPRSQLADLIIAMPAGIDEHFPKRIQFLYGHRKLFPQQVHQSGNAGRAAGHHNALDILTARRGAEEVECLLYFQRENVGNAAQNLLLLLVRHAWQRIALLEPLRVLEAQVQFFL